MGRSTGYLGHAYSGRTHSTPGLIADFEKQCEDRFVGIGIAQVYSGLGDRDRAFEWIARAEQLTLIGPSS